MNKLNVVFVCLLVFMSSSLAFCVELGSTKIMLPTSGCIIKVDDIPVEAGNNDHINVQVEPGYHHVNVAYTDGIRLYDGTIKVNSNNETIVRPDIPDELLNKIDAEKAKKYLKEKNDAETYDTDYYPGAMGISLGMDGSNVTGILEILGASPFGGSSHISSAGYSSLYVLSFFNVWKLDNKWYTDIDIGVMSNTAPEKSSILFAYYLGYGLKYKPNNFLMFGIRPIISEWSGTSYGEYVNSVPGTGIQIFFEIMPLSTEIGYVSRYVEKAMSGGLPGLSAPNDTFSGIYFKYKIFL